MKTYLVGGAVRDALLGLSIHERDWVVVGATAHEMQVAGYVQVGRDFPVFLHPSTKEEYALARTERKQGQGYHGFVCFAAPDVTLEQDLQRRDLTINAIAQEVVSGDLIDPYQGQQDLALRQLRHVSDAFTEDPLRVLRVARFVAQLSEFSFQIAPETWQLMQSMVQQRMLLELTPERVWLETVKAFRTHRPSLYFRTLFELGALQQLMPEVAILFSVPQEVKWHPEGDAGVHTLMVLDAMRRQTDDIGCLWAALCHDLGKGVTKPEYWPKHPDHELNGVSLVTLLSQRYRAPVAVQQLAELVCRWHGMIHKANELSAEQRLEVLEACDAWRRPERFTEVLAVCRADSEGRLGCETEIYPQEACWQAWLAAGLSVDVRRFVALGLQGKAIGEAVRNERLSLMNDCM